MYYTIDDYLKNSGSFLESLSFENKQLVLKNLNTYFEFIENFNRLHSVEQVASLKDNDIFSSFLNIDPLFIDIISSDNNFFQQFITIFYRVKDYFAANINNYIKILEIIDNLKISTLGNIYSCLPDINIYLFVSEIDARKHNRLCEYLNEEDSNRIKNRTNCYYDKDLRAYEKVDFEKVIDYENIINNLEKLGINESLNNLKSIIHIYSFITLHRIHPGSSFDAVTYNGVVYLNNIVIYESVLFHELLHHYSTHEGYTGVGYNYHDFDTGFNESVTDYFTMKMYPNGMSSDAGLSVGARMIKELIDAKIFDEDKLLENYLASNPEYIHECAKKCGLSSGFDIMIKFSCAMESNTYGKIKELTSFVDDLCKNNITELTEVKTR